MSVIAPALVSASEATEEEKPIGTALPFPPVAPLSVEAFSLLQEDNRRSKMTAQEGAVKNRVRL